MEMDAICRFNFTLGGTLGALARDDVKQWLTDREVTEEQIEEAKKALMVLAEAAYRQAKGGR